MIFCLKKQPQWQSLSPSNLDSTLTNFAASCTTADDTGSCLLTIVTPATVTISVRDSLSAGFSVPGDQPDNASIMVDFHTTPIT